VTEEEASEIAERAIRNVFLDYEDPPPEAEFTAKALEATAEATRGIVADKRRKLSDPQLHHDPEDHRYERNLHLERLQHRNGDDGFHDREWDRLPSLLKPLALATLQRKGVRGPDAEEVFNDSLAELVKPRRDDGRAPIEEPTVFEELIPLHARIVGFRAVDWHRRRGSLKNQPNNGESLEGLCENEGRAMQFEDPAADPDQTRFEQIYRQCREALEPQEWELIFTLYVAQSATVQDLIHDPEFCRRHGLRASASTRRRMLNDLVETALEKIRKHLVF